MNDKERLIWALKWLEDFVSVADHYCPLRTDTFRAESVTLRRKDNVLDEAMDEAGL
jgi:hypothetical protein